jgi:hypothetical protein
MLIFNLTALSNLQIRKMIWARCQAFGRVKGVSIHRRSSVNPRAYALVDMGSVTEVKRVIRAVGDSLLGGSALIELTQDAPFGDQSAHVERGARGACRASRDPLLARHQRALRAPGHARTAVAVARRSPPSGVP